MTTKELDGCPEGYVNNLDKLNKLCSFSVNDRTYVGTLLGLRNIGSKFDWTYCIKLADGNEIYIPCHKTIINEIQ